MSHVATHSHGTARHHTSGSARPLIGASLVGGAVAGEVARRAATNGALRPAANMARFGFAGAALAGSTALVGRSVVAQGAGGIVGSRDGRTGALVTVGAMGPVALAAMQASRTPGSVASKVGAIAAGKPLMMRPGGAAGLALLTTGSLALAGANELGAFDRFGR